MCMQQYSWWIWQPFHEYKIMKILEYYILFESLENLGYYGISFNKFSNSCLHNQLALSFCYNSNDLANISYVVFTCTYIHIPIKQAIYHWLLGLMSSETNLITYSYICMHQMYCYDFLICDYIILLHPQRGMLQPAYKR